MTLSTIPGYFAAIKKAVLAPSLYPSMEKRGKLRCCNNNYCEYKVKNSSAKSKKSDVQYFHETNHHFHVLVQHIDFPMSLCSTAAVARWIPADQRIDVLIESFKLGGKICLFRPCKIQRLQYNPSRGTTYREYQN